MVEWFRRSASNLVTSTRLGSNPIAEPLITREQAAQLSILPRSVNEYSEVTLRAQVVIPQAQINRIPAHSPSQPMLTNGKKKKERKKERKKEKKKKRK